MRRLFRLRSRILQNNCRSIQPEKMDEIVLALCRDFECYDYPLWKLCDIHDKMKKICTWTAVGGAADVLIRSQHGGNKGAEYRTSKCCQKI